MIVMRSDEGYIAVLNAKLLNVALRLHYSGERQTRVEAGVLLTSVMRHSKFLAEVDASQLVSLLDLLE